MDEEYGNSQLNRKSTNRFLKNTIINDRRYIYSEEFNNVKEISLNRKITIHY